MVPAGGGKAVRDRDRRRAVEVIRKTLFESERLQTGLFEAHPVSDACGDIERQSLNALVLPLTGVFSKHDAPGRYVVGTPSHAIFLLRTHRTGSDFRAPLATR